MPELVRALLLRYLHRFWFRAIQAGGQLDDLFVTLDEVREALDPGSEPPPGLPDAETVAERLRAARARLAATLAGAAISPTRDASPPLRPSGDRSESAPEAAEVPPAQVGRGTSAAPTRLRSLAGLSPEALELLLVAATLQGNPGLLRTSTFAWADFAVKQPTVAFLVELCGDTPEHQARLRAALGSEAPLRRLFLVVLGDDRAWQPTTPLLQRPVAVPDAVAGFLEGGPVVSDHLPPGALRREPAAGPGTQELILEGGERLVAVLQRCCRGLDRVPVALVGPAGTGRRTIARAFAVAAGRPLWVLNLEALDSALPAFEAQLGAALRDTWLAGGVLLIRLPDLPPNDRRLGLMTRLQRRVPVPVILAADTGAVAALLPHLPELRVVELDAASASTRGRLFRHLLAENAFVASPDRLAHLIDAYRLTPGDLDRALSDVRVELGDDPSLDEAGFDRAVRRQVRTRLGDLAERVTTGQTWDDLIIGEEPRVIIGEILSHARHRTQVFDTWGLGDKVGGRGKGIACLFSGPPGTGKTMTAALLARDLGLDLFQVDLSRIVDKYVGETEKNLARLFSEASKLPVVLLFDEADSLFAARTKVESSNDRYANLEVNYLLQLMERHEGISILTTNQGTGIDQAFMRRLRFRVHFGLPGVADRTRLWRAMVPPGAEVAADVDFEWLARRWEMSGALIRNAFVRAAFLAADGEGRLTQALLVRAAQAELSEVGRLGSL